MKPKATKTFDAVAESRKWRAASSALLAKMTPWERIAFLNRRASHFRPAGKKSAERKSFERFREP
jgi:hypothetical protein